MYATAVTNLRASHVRVEHRAAAAYVVCNGCSESQLRSPALCSAWTNEGRMLRHWFSFAALLYDVFSLSCLLLSCIGLRLSSSLSTRRAQTPPPSLFLGVHFMLLSSSQEVPVLPPIEQCDRNRTATVVLGRSFFQREESFPVRLFRSLRSWGLYLRWR